MVARRAAPTLGGKSTLMLGNGDAGIERTCTIDLYIQSALPEGQPHLRKLYAILKRAAPEADEAISGATLSCGTAIPVSPSAHKAHLSFAPTAAALDAFRDELKGHKTTKNFLQVPYNKPLPEDLIRRIAEHCVRALREREDDAFW